MPKSSYKKAVPATDQSGNDDARSGRRKRWTRPLVSAAVLTALSQLRSSLDGWTIYWTGNRASSILSPLLIPTNNSQSVQFATNTSGTTNDTANISFQWNESLLRFGSSSRLQKLLDAGESSISSYPDNDIRSIYDPPSLKVKELQPWTINYLNWHAAMLEKFPGSQLLDHPDAPKLLIKVCMERLDRCGGMNDRMHTIPVYMAAKTNRVLLYKWMHPHSLEDFLEPNIVNWTVPDSDTIPINDAVYLREKLIINGWKQQRSPYKNTYTRLRDDPVIIPEKIVTFYTGGDTLIEIKKERDENNITESDTEFGTLWHLFFRPSLPVEQEVTNTMTRNGLVAHQFVATHVRIRHPGRRSFLKDTSPMTSKEGSNEWLSVDSTGLEFEGKSKEMMIDVGTHAVNCTNLLREFPEEPIYFFSDSEDLVRYMTLEVGATSPKMNETTLSENRSIAMKEAIAPGRIVGRAVTKKTAHLDLEDAPDASYYYGAFVDLYLGMAARCVSYGIGNYAVLSTKISNTHCLQSHERLRPQIARQWGTKLRELKGDQCPIPAYEAAMR